MVVDFAGHLLVVAKGQMSITRDSFYFDYEPFLMERLTTDDINALATQEDDWVNQARASMSADQFTAAESQWAQWQAETPAYRILAYDDNFGGYAADVPEILTVAVGWLPSDNEQAMQPLFAKANDAIANGSSAPSTGNPATAPRTVGLSGAGMLLAGVALFWWLSSRK